MDGELEAQQALPITARADGLQSFKEQWNWANCEKSLSSQGLYEAPGNVFWLRLDIPTWEGSELPACRLTYGQIAAGRKMWSDEKYDRSAVGDASKRHYLINSVLPIAVLSIADATEKLRSVPCLASRGILAGLYSTFDDALRANNWQQIRALYQAALAMPMRMRVGPSRQQVVLDNITYSEELFVAKLTASDAFYDFATKAGELIPTLENMTAKAVVERCSELGIAFHAQKVNDNIARALQNVYPYIRSGEVREALKLLEDVSPQLNDQSKISVLMHTASKTFTKGSAAAKGALAQLTNALRIAIEYKDIAKDSHVTKEFLTGAKHKAGYAQMFFKRLAFLEFLESMIKASTGSHAEEVRDKIFPQMLRQAAFIQNFCPSRSVAAVGAASLSSEATTIDPEEEPESKPQRLGNASAEKYGEFRETLTPTGRIMADLLSKTQCGQLDPCFLEVANEEAKAAPRCFAWADLFTTAGSEAKGKSKKDADDDNKLPLTDLRLACLKWLESMWAAPQAAASDEPVGNEDRCVMAASGADGDEDGERKKTVAKLNRLLAESVLVQHIPGGEYSQSNLTKAFHATAPSAEQYAKRTGPPGKETPKCTAIVVSAELFPPHASAHAPDMFRGVPSHPSGEFRDLVNFALTAKQSADVVLIADGRSEGMRSAIREIVKSTVGDDFLELWVVYDMETSLNSDARNPKRKVAWSGANMETIFVALPSASKGQRKVVARTAFTKSGEATNFSRTFTGVPFRNVAELPRVTADVKQGILGKSAVGTFNKQRVQKEVEEKGHPLFWGEWKPIQLWTTLFAEFGATEIADFTAGTGATAIAALYRGVHCRAFCHNASHQNWLQTLLQRICLALTADKKLKVSADEELRSNVERYLRRAAEGARKLLPQESSAVGDRRSAVGDRCDDDSADDE